jgi:hypothetical protein
MENVFQEGNFFWVLTLHYNDHSQTHHFMSKENAQRFATEELFDNDDCTGCSIHRELFRSFAEDLAWRMEQQRQKELDKLNLPF